MGHEPVGVLSMEVMTPALVVTPHPLTLQGQRVLDTVAAEFCPGDTLSELLARQGVLAGQQWVVCIGGVEVPEEHWGRVRPKHGHLIEARRVPQKDILRIVAIAALSYFTFGAGGAAIFGTGFYGTIAAGAVFLAGSMVINKLLAPKQLGRAENTVNPTYSLNGGGRNRARAYEPMALVLGEPYAVPDIAAQPYTYFANGEQYLWQMFHLGLNCADASILRIGQTALSAYQGVSVLRNGLSSGNSDFPALGTSVDSVAGAMLINSDWTTRITSAGTVRIALDFVAALFSTNREGVFIPLELNLTAQFRAIDDDNWIGFTPGVVSVPAVVELVREDSRDDSSGFIEFFRVITPAVEGYPAGTIRVRNASQKPLRFTVELAVPAGQYEVRIFKASPDTTLQNESNSVEWVQLRSYQQDMAIYDGQARLAVQIQASGQLNGALDELNCQLRAAPMDYWNGSSWVTAVDRATGLCNPGAIFLMLVRGIFDTSGKRLAGLGYSDDQIDIEGLKRFMVRCASAGFQFDLFLQESTSLQDLLDAVAYAGMGELAWPDGKIGVTFFTRDDPIEGVINMANIKARTFEVDYATMPTADEIEFQYFDRTRGNAWKPIRVLAPGVVMPRSTASQQFIGVTAESHAATLARFSMAQNIYQRKTVTLEQDLEYMTYRKGSVVAVSHDLTQWGYSGRLLACQDVAGVITLTLDDIAPGDLPSGASTRYIGLRLPGETQMRALPVAAFSGEARTVTLDGAWPSGLPLPGSTSDNPARDTVWIYDFKATPGQRMRVASIEPSSNGARMVLVPETVEFWDYTETGDYQPPPNNSLLRPAPDVSRVIVSEQLARQGNTYYTELSVNFESTGAFNRAELWGAVGAGEISPPQRLLDSGRSQTLSWQGGLDERWHLELRLYGDARASVPYRFFFDVQGLREPPPDVTDLTVNGNTVSWTPVDVPDLAGYLIRFQYGSGTWWDTAVPLHTGVVTESPYTLTRRPQGDVTVLVKAVDTTGNQSVNAASFRYGFSEIAVRNPVFTADQHPTFPGVIVGGAVSSGDLKANNLDLFYEPESGPMYTPTAEAMYGTSQFGEMTYEFSVNSTEQGVLILQYAIATESLLIEYQIGSSDPLYAPTGDPMYEPTDELLYGQFGDWLVWPGSIDFDGASAFRFRLTLAAGLSQSVIDELTALIDAPEISELVDDAVIGSGGTRLTLTNTYSVIRSVQLTVQGGGSGVTARYIDKDAVLGPLVEILNASGIAVAGVLDAQIRGY